MAEESKKKIISGVGLLDIRQATKETLSNIHRLTGIGTVLCSPETKPYLSQVAMEGVGSVVETPLDVKMMMGQTVLSKDSFDSTQEPLNLVMMGQAVIEPDVTAEDVDKGLGELFVIGQLICPKHLSGVMQAKMREMTGQVYYYSHKSPRIVLGDLNFDVHYLNGLADDSEILVVGKLNMLDVLPNDVLDRKVAKLSVIGKVTLREENAALYHAKSDNKDLGTKITMIPEGFEWIRRELILDASRMRSLSDQSLYCTHTVRIESDVTAEVFDAAVNHLKCTGWVLCPEALRSVFEKKCDMLNTRVIFYAKTLWVVDDNLELIPSRFDYLDNLVTLVVMDRLKIHPDVDGKMLFERFDKIHNFGKIICSQEQMGAIQARLGTDDGDLIRPKEKKEKPEEKKKDLYELIEGIGTLRL